MENNTVTIPVQEYRELVENWAIMDYITTDVSDNSDDEKYEEQFTYKIDSKYHVGDKFRNKNLSEQYTIEHVCKNVIDGDRQYLLYIEEYAVEDGFENFVEDYYEMAAEEFLNENCVKLN